MAADDRNAFEVYRDRVDRPLLRLFREYGALEAHWLAIGMAANVIARVAGWSRRSCSVSPSTPSSPEPARTPSRSFRTRGYRPRPPQFRLSVALIVGSFLITGVFTWIYGIAANNFAHRVMHAVRTDSFDRMQRLDMTFFDDKQTGEVMSVLNNDASNLEVFLDNALQNSARLGVMLVGIAGVLFYYNHELAVVTLSVIP